MEQGIVITANTDEVLARFAGAKAYVIGAAKKVVSSAAIKLQRHIREDLFQPYPGGTTNSTLSTRSGILKKSVKTIPPSVDGTDVKSGVTIGTKYSPVHFGPVGQVTHITPKRGKFLAIPMQEAMNGQGVAKGAPRDESIYGQTFVAKSKAGNLVIFGKLLYVKGKKSGQAKGDLKPLFVLKSSVDVPARIHPEDLRGYIMPHITEGMQAIKQGLENSSLSDNFGTGTEGEI
jgi:hypothetical protein